LKKAATNSSTHLSVSYITKLHCPLNNKPFKSHTSKHGWGAAESQAAGNSPSSFPNHIKPEIARVNW